MSVVASELYDLKPVILFGFGWEEAVTALVGYTELAFTGFAQVYLVYSPLMAHTRDRKSVVCAIRS